MTDSLYLNSLWFICNQIKLNETWHLLYQNMASFTQSNQITDNYYLILKQRNDILRD